LGLNIRHGGNIQRVRGRRCRRRTQWKAPQLYLNQKSKAPVSIDFTPIAKPPRHSFERPYCLPQ